MESRLSPKRRNPVPLTESIKANRKLLLGLLCVVFFVAYITGAAPSSPNITKSLPSIQKWIPDTTYFLGLRPRKRIIIHPIPKLMADAQANFKKLIQKQSKTVAQASKEYRRRYKRDPPKGFDEWFAFAQENQVKIIDDYDQLMADLEPYWQLSGEELRRRAVQVSLPLPIRRRLSEIREH